jgi:hypothetical protein
MKKSPSSDGDFLLYSLVYRSILLFYRLIFLSIGQFSSSIGRFSSSIGRFSSLSANSPLLSANFPLLSADFPLYRPIFLFYRPIFLFYRPTSAFMIKKDGLRSSFATRGMRRMPSSVGIGSSISCSVKPARMSPFSNVVSVRW